ncbi:MAG: hypothetical protein ACRD2D_04420 [Terriglobales bacterium]
MKAIFLVFRYELGKSFFARRGLWVYLLALAPLLLFVAYSLQSRMDQQYRQALAARQQQPITAADVAGIRRGMSEAEVETRLGPPPRRFTRAFRRRTAQGTIAWVPTEWLRYADATSDYTVILTSGTGGFTVRSVRTLSTPTLASLAPTFASVFQFFFLRLVVFFGCLGIFMNLFRGELLDKSLHYYFLAPIRREYVLAGKFLAGLVAATVIFVASDLLQLGILAARTGAWLPHAAAYLGITALACLGYGAVFLAAGLMFRNPIVPAAALLVWESLNPFLPELLKRISVIYYLGQLSPVSATMPGISPLYALLISAPGALSPAAAIVSLLVVAALALYWSTLRVRRLEIDYAAD